MSPSKNLQRLARSLFDVEDRRCEFINSLSGGVSSAEEALIWLRPRPESNPFAVRPRLAWQPAFVDRLEAGQLPGRHSLHDQGSYYCLDFSSVVCAIPFLQHGDPGGRVLDVCAAPGGKTVIAAAGLQPQLLICNEVIGKRIPALVSNIKRCALAAKVISHDVSYLADTDAESFDLVVVDAPCSGQSLVAKGDAAPGCFHPATINMNSNRQKRIIANAARCVKAGGLLAYMTCTFSRAENEGIGEWFMQKFPGFHALETPALDGFRSHLADFPAYRLWPMDGLGAGGFSALFERVG